MWMNSIHNCLSPDRTGVIAFLDLRQPVWGPSLPLEDMAGFLFSCSGALTFMWQHAPKGGEVWCSSPPSFPSLHVLSPPSLPPNHRSAPYTWVTGEDVFSVHIIFTVPSSDSLKLNGCKCSWAVSTSLGDSDIGRFFPVLPLTLLLCLSLLCYPCL